MEWIRLPKTQHSRSRPGYIRQPTRRVGAERAHHHARHVKSPRHSRERMFVTASPRMAGTKSGHAEWRNSPTSFIPFNFYYASYDLACKPQYQKLMWDMTGNNPEKKAGPLLMKEIVLNCSPYHEAFKYSVAGWPNCHFDAEISPGQGSALILRLGGVDLSVYTDPKSKNWDVSNPTTSGASAWHRFAPLKPKGNLFEFLGNLPKLPHLLEGECFKYAKSWASHTKGLTNPSWNGGLSSAAKSWLEYNFGYLPTFHDVKRMVSTAETSPQAYQRFVEKNGKWERRGGHLFTIDQNGTDNFNAPYGFEGVRSSYGHCDWTATTEEWFSAQYRYYIPEHSFKGSPWYRDLRHAGFISPRALYNLVPWTWLIDWFSDFGDLISNLESMQLDNLGAKNECLMRRQRINGVLTYIVTWKNGATKQYQWSGHSTISSRVLTSPFGIGSFSGLTPKQNSLLAALGIDRLTNLVSRYH